MVLTSVTSGSDSTTTGQSISTWSPSKTFKMAMIMIMIIIITIIINNIIIVNYDYNN